MSHATWRARRTAAPTLILARTLSRSALVMVYGSYGNCDKTLVRNITVPWDGLSQRIGSRSRKSCPTPPLGLQGGAYTPWTILLTKKENSNFFFSRSKKTLKEKYTFRRRSVSVHRFLSELKILLHHGARARCVERRCPVLGQTNFRCYEIMTSLYKWYSIYKGKSWFHNSEN